MNWEFRNSRTQLTTPDQARRRRSRATNVRRTDDAVLFVARWLERLVVEEDMHRELSCVDTARPTADACPAEFHVFDALSETGKKTLE